MPLPLVLERALTPALVIGAMAYFCSSSNFRILTQRRVRPDAAWASDDRGAADAHVFADARALLGCAYWMVMPFEVALCLRRCGASMGALGAARVCHQLRRGGSACVSLKWYAAGLRSEQCGNLVTGIVAEVFGVAARRLRALRGHSSKLFPCSS